jgi:transposase
MTEAVRITLTTFEQRRLTVLNHLEAGGLVNAEAAQLLNLSVRQVRRLRSDYRKRGAAALRHGNRGRQAHNAVEPDLARRVVELATTKYADFNQQHLTEMLTEEEGIKLSRPSVHRILKAAGVPAPRGRRPPRHGRRRNCYLREGMLIHFDASRHDWLEGRGPILSLLGAIDDATGRVTWACFREQEDEQGYFEVMRKTVCQLGIPMAAYADRHSSLVQSPDKPLTIEEQLNDRREPTQFRRLLEELGVPLIRARSPEATSRIQCLWRAFRDRLASDLQLAQASTLLDANQLLARHLPLHNLRFTVAPQDPEPAWLAWPKDRRLEESFCLKYRGLVQNDNTVRFGAHVIDMPASRERSNYARARVEVHVRFDGHLCVYMNGICLVQQVVSEPRSAYLAGEDSDACLAQSDPPKLATKRQPTGEMRRPGPTLPWSYVPVGSV